MNSKSLLNSVAAAVCVVVVNSPAAAAETRTRYEIPSQDLGTALRRVGQIAGVEIMFTPSDVAGLIAPQLDGEFTLNEALDRLLAGTDLTAQVSAGTVIIRGRAQPAGVPAGEIATPEIVVTGTHIRGALPSAPVQTFTRSKIEGQGFTDLGQFARSIPQNFNGGQNPGIAGGGDQGTGNENASSSSALNLRGLGPAATLTLLDGHRLAYDTIDQGVDLSQIPVEAIDRIEIVPDGSSAMYGSDAVGGVANVILRRDYDGLLASAHLAGSTEGGDTQQNYDLLTGARWRSGGAMFAAAYSSVSAVTAGQRVYTSQLDPSSTLLPRQRQVSFVAAGHQKLTDDLSLTFDAQFNKRSSQTSSPTTTVRDVRVDGLISKPRVTSATANAALRWDMGGSWTVSASGTYGFSNNHVFSRRFSAGSESFRSFLHYNNSVASAEVDAEGALFRLSGGDARLALGAGYRHAGLDVLTRRVSGGTSTTLSDFDSGRDVYFGYGELSLPVVGAANALPVVHKLQFDIAGRYEDYPGNAQLLTPKLGVVYQPTESITVRASWGKSFKTQTLYQQYQTRQGVLLPAAIFQSPPSALPVLLLAGGNADLKPERATTWSAGITVEPRGIDGLKIEATYFDIRYKDRVVSPVTTILGAFADPIFAPYVTISPPAAEVSSAVDQLPQGLSNQSGGPFDPAAVGAIIDTSLQNAARQHIKGVDLAVHYRIDFAPEDSLSLDGSASYLHSDQQLSAGQPRLPLAGTIFNPPHWRSHLGASWQHANVTLSAFGNIIGETLDNRYPERRHVGAFTTVDLVAQIRSRAASGVFAGTELTVSIANLFDEQPASIRNTIDTDPPYDSTNSSVAGRVIGLTASKSF